MFGRGFLFVGVLTAAVVVPYLLTSQRWSETTAALRTAIWPNSAKDADRQGSSGWGDLPGLSQGDLTAFPPGSESARLDGRQMPSAHSPVQSIHQILRFDVTPEWIIGHWPRVTNTLAGTDLEGFRVPLVTGTNVHDLAGSLTYYYDRQRTLRRITIQGTTGDERPLVGLVTQYYRLKWEPALGGGLFVQRWNGRPTSILRVRRAAVVRADAPHNQKTVWLELNRPGFHYELSDRSQELLDARH
jgi:hypothetical protein